MNETKVLGTRDIITIARTNYPEANCRNQSTLFQSSVGTQHLNK